MITPLDILNYLLALKEEECTATTVEGVTDNPYIPLVVIHLGDACPIHEGVDV